MIKLFNCLTQAKLISKQIKQLVYANLGPSKIQGRISGGERERRIMGRHYDGAADLVRRHQLVMYIKVAGTFGRSNSLFAGDSTLGS